VSDVGAAREAASGILVERLPGHGDQRLRQPESRVERGRGLGDDLVDDALGPIRLEGPPAREHLVEDDPHRPHVGPAVHLLALQDLGGEVAGRAQDHSRLRQVGAVETSDAEVEDLDDAALGDPDVGGLDVAMDDPHRVGEVQGAADVHHHPDLLLEREPVDGDHGVAELDAFHELHGDVVRSLLLAQLEYGHDVRMLELGRRPRLTLEARERVPAGEERRGDRLEGDQPLEDGVAGAVDGAHRTLARDAQDLVLSELPGNLRAQARLS
jgi:hypothetical protein